MKTYIFKIKNNKGEVRVRTVQLTNERHSDFAKRINKEINGYTLISIFEM